MFLRNIIMQIKVYRSTLRDLRYWHMVNALQLLIQQMTASLFNFNMRRIFLPIFTSEKLEYSHSMF